MWYYHYKVMSSIPLTTTIHRIVFKAVDKPIPGARAGQFAMLYMPQRGELPLSVFRQNGGELQFVVEDYGGPSHSAVLLREGETVGVRGPYGKGFTLRPNTNYLLVAGGSGAPPLLKFLEEARRVEGVRLTYVMGAKSQSELFLLDEAEKLGAAVAVSTDDGSKGFKGYVTLLAEKLLSENRYDALYVCGPEPMLQASIGLAKKFEIYFEGSFVRDVRCAVGLCGLCVMEGTGLLLCVDGPVFRLDELETLEQYVDLSQKSQTMSGEGKTS